MKKRKYLLKGIIIGICMTIVPLILMGTTNKNTYNNEGRYQISTTMHDTHDGNFNVYIFETIIDTKTGNVTSRKKTRENRYY